MPKMVDHADMIQELPYVERVQLTERLKNAKKQRALQLKGYDQREKRLAKEQASASKKSAKKNKKTSSIDDEPEKTQESRARLRFSDSVLMMDAVSRGDTEEVKRLLESGVSPNIRGQDGLTALHQSCIDNAFTMVQLLIESNADVNARDMEMWTPLHAVATCGHLELCRYLCEHGGDLLAMNSDGNMPYDLCEDIATLDYIETEMTRQGITQELIDDTRLGTENNMLSDLKKLSDGSSIINTYRGANGETLLHIASCCGFTLVTKFLIDNHVQLDVMDNDSWQPVHCAAFWGQPGVVELLLTNGVDPDAKTRDGETAIDLCEDPDAKQRIMEIVDAVKHKRKLMQFLHKGNSNSGDRSSSRRMSSTRRSSIASPASLACQRRSSLHERRDSISLRDLREESQHFHECLLASKFDDDDESNQSCSSQSNVADSSKVVIVVSPPNEPVVNGCDECGNEDIDLSEDPDSKTALLSQATTNSEPSNVMLENGGSIVASPQSGAGDAAAAGGPVSKSDNCDSTAKVKIPSSPSSAVTDKKKHCGTGCCNVA